MKKTIWILTIITLMYIFIGMPCNVLAAVIQDSDMDDTTATANVIHIGDTLNGSITETDDLDYYQFSLESAGCVKLEMTSYMRYYCIKILETDGEEVWYTYDNEWTETVGYRRDVYNVYLEKGTYYMEINGYDGVHYRDPYKSTGKYECDTDFVSSGVNNVESDNSFETANYIVLGNTITGQISRNDNYDTFKFLLSETGCVTIDMTSYMQYYCIQLFDIDGDQIWHTYDNEWTETVGYRCDTYNLYLKKGTYYMQISGYDGVHYRDPYKSTGKYVIDTHFESTNTSFESNDNSFADANFVSWNKEYTGQISINDDFDTYKFQVSGDQNIVLSITSYMRYYCLYIFNSDGDRIWRSENNEWNNNVGYRTDIYDDLVLSAGTYYVQINGYDGTYYNRYESTGKYVFSISELSQDNCSHDYESEIVDATYFKQGYTIYTCRVCKKTYIDSYTAKKILESVSLSSYYTIVGKNKIKESWTENTEASGYEFRYSTSRLFKKNVVKITIKKNNKTYAITRRLKRKKKYYVQVRPYKKIGSRIVYGRWSGTASFKLK